MQVRVELADLCEVLREGLQAAYDVGLLRHDMGKLKDQIHQHAVGIENTLATLQTAGTTSEFMAGIASIRARLTRLEQLST